LDAVGALDKVGKFDGASEIVNVGKKVKAGSKVGKGVFAPDLPIFDLLLDRPDIPLPPFPRPLLPRLRFALLDDLLDRL